MLIAARAFLGSLRDRLNRPTHGRIMFKVAKYLVHLDAATLRQYLLGRLYSAVVVRAPGHVGTCASSEIFRLNRRAYAYLQFHDSIPKCLTECTFATTG